MKPDHEKRARDLFPDRPEHDPRWTQAVRGMIAQALRESYEAGLEAGAYVARQWMPRCDCAVFADCGLCNPNEAIPAAIRALKSKNGGE